MTAPQRIRAELAGMAALSAPPREHRPRPLPEVLREIEAATAALATTTKGWAAFLPRPAALDEAQSTATGLHRLLGELREHCQGGPTDGMA